MTYKRGKYLRIMIAICITAGIASACTPKNSDPAMMANGSGSETEVSDAAMPNQTAADSMISDSDMQLTQENREQIEFLLNSLRHTIWYGSFENFLTDKPILNDEIKENELEMQARFLMSLCNAQVAQDVTAILSPAVHSIEPHEDLFTVMMTVTIEQANQLIRMAGGVPNPELKSYLEDEYHSVEKNGELFTFYYYPEETEWKNEIKEVIYLKDGRIKMTGQSRLGWEVTEEQSYFYMHNGGILDFEVMLTPNKESVFGGYSVEHFWQSTVNPEGVRKIGEEAAMRPYQKPEALSEYSYDYIFELEGDLYQMPFPVREFIENGWIIEESGGLDSGERANIHILKDGMRLSAAIWNYNQEPADFKNCTVVWLRTRSSETWADVDFNVDGIKNKSIVQSQPTKIYYKNDPLYNGNYGFSIHIEDGSAIGFEIGYAPGLENRKERASLLTGWEKDPIAQGSNSKLVDVARNLIYQIDIDRDGKKEAIELKYLSNAPWGEEWLSILIDGEVTGSINEWLFGAETFQLSIAEQGAILYVSGHDEYGTECSAKYLLNKIQSEVIMDTGMRWIDGETYYLEVENGVGQLATGWRTIYDRVWYFAANGKMLTGLQEIDGIKYFFHPVGQLAMSSQEKDPLTGRIYWADQNGVCTEIKDYILPESDSRFYTEKEIRALSKEQLRLARNEIYARHGRKFAATDLQQYFNEKSWYSPIYEVDYFDAKGDELFNEYELANRDLITAVEAASETKINLLGDYVIQGELYIAVDKYYIQDSILYVEGSLCDGIYNPDGEAESDTMDFFLVNNYNVTVKIDNETAILIEPFLADETYNDMDIYEIKAHLDNIIYWFHDTYICIQLDGDHVEAYLGNWQSS
ncbi:MAG: YARHG domain-containing protein [Lachnospiraceae bacterium]